MHRTQIYFEESDFEKIKERARARNMSAAALIRELVSKELHKQDSAPSTDLLAFKGLWKGRDIDLDAIRKEAWK
jgi:predicted DNA-binding ribbon-helix-helix protein